MIQGLGKGHGQWRARVGRRRLQLPFLRIDRLIIGRAGREGLAMAFLQRQVVAVGPLPIDDQGVTLAGFEDRAEVLARFQATFDPARNNKARS